jgi:phospholipase C
MELNRRAFVKVALGASGSVMLSSCIPPIQPRPRHHHLPNPEHSGIEHVVVVMMENRSFDHMLGWLPGADGRRAGLSYATPDGVQHPTFHQTQLNGCGFKDPDHSYEGGRVQYNHGAMDGFLTDTSNDSFAISYYNAADRPFMSSLARNYTACDRYFCAILGPTFPNRIFQHAGQTDRLSNTSAQATLPTIWDRLNQKSGPTGRYYYSDLPFVGLWGTTYLPISAKVDQFFSDAAAGTLPNVSYIDPGFLGEGAGVSNDDHPLADLRAGDAFLSKIFHALASGPGWAHTVLVINYDEWGGFFEHVPPNRVTAGVPIGANPATGIDTDLDANGKVLTGFRVPCIIASPFARRRFWGGSVAHELYDHTSVLKMIEWRWGLEPLSARDASHARTDPMNLAYALDFIAPDTTVPSSVPNLAPFVPTACGVTNTTANSAPASSSNDLAGREDWVALEQSELLHGWHLTPVS